MIRHRIIWKLKDELTEEQKIAIKADAKKHLEDLCGKIPGLLSMQITIDPLPGSTGDMMLDSLFSDLDSLKGYAKHPEHVLVANTYVRPYTASRACMDYESEI